MDTVVIPNFKFLDQQFAYLDVFLAGTGTLHSQFMKGTMAGINVKMAATLITKKIDGVYKISDEVHPHVLRFTNLLTDTIFAVRSEFLTQNPDKLVFKSDEKDAKKFYKTAKPMFDKEGRSNLSKWITKLRGMVVKHKEYVYNMEKESRTIYGLLEKIQWREAVIRQRFAESDTEISEQEINYTLLNDFTLRFHKQAFRILGLEALKTHTKIMEKKVKLENEMKQLENKIMSAIETQMRHRLVESITKLVRIHEINCFKQNSISDIQRSMIKLIDSIGNVVSDVIETNSTQYNFNPSSEDSMRIGLMRNVRKMDKILMGNTTEELHIDVPKYETKQYSLQTTDLGECFKKASNYRNCKTILIQQSTSAKTKETVKQKLSKDNIVFGWTKASKFSSKKYGFYNLNNAVHS